MILTPGGSLLMGGHRNVVTEYDLQQQQEIRQVREKRLLTSLQSGVDDGFIWWFYLVVLSGGFISWWCFRWISVNRAVRSSSSLLMAICARGTPAEK